MIKLFHRDPPPMQIHYTIYQGWWIEEKKAKSCTSWDGPTFRAVMPEYRIYPSLRAATSGENRGLVTNSLESARGIIDRIWGPI